MTRTKRQRDRRAGKLASAGQPRARVVLGSKEGTTLYSASRDSIVGFQQRKAAMILPFITTSIDVRKLLMRYTIHQCVQAQSSSDVTQR